MVDYSPCFLAIESSCDETAIAIFQQTLRAHTLHSQISMHQNYGGVVPELASRDHLTHIFPLIQQALDIAKKTLNDIDAIAYTKGPGLAGCLLVGASVAKSLAYALGKPSLAIHHLEGHLFAPWLTENLSVPIEPFLALLVSGGHTQLLAVEGIGRYTLLGDTLDDALGEAFDKTAKMLGFPYPGGAQVSAWAQKGEAVFDLPTPLLHHKNLDFSFAGLKTAVLRCIQTHQTQGLTDEIKQNICASFVRSVVTVVEKKVANAIHETGLKRLIVSGGVSANQDLRQTLQNLGKKENVEVIFPSLAFCTDNAAMIAMAAHLRYENAKQKHHKDVHLKDLDLWDHHHHAIEIVPRWELSADFS